MKNRIIKTTITFALSLCCIFSFLTISKAHEVYASYYRYVNANSLIVRKTASSKGKVMGSYKKGTKLKCYSKKGDWTRIKYKNSKYYVATRYLATKKPAVATTTTDFSTKTSTYTRYVTASSLTIRKQASTSAAKAGSYKRGTSITCYGNKSGWTTVKYGGNYCYVSSDYLSATKPSTTSSSSQTTSTAAKGEEVAKYALRFKGLAYKWGGESLTSGVDCSGFTMKIYEHFGYSLPHSSTAQRYSGTAVSWANKQPGDLICYEMINGVGHVGIYIGNNQVVHAGSTSTGVHVSAANYRAVNCVRRIVR